MKTKKKQIKKKANKKCEDCSDSLIFGVIATLMVVVLVGVGHQIYSEVTSIKKYDCVEAEYESLSNMNTSYGIALSDEDLSKETVLVLTDDGRKLYAETNYINVVDCKYYDRAKELNK